MGNKFHILEIEFEVIPNKAASYNLYFDEDEINDDLDSKFSILDINKIKIYIKKDNNEYLKRYTESVEISDDKLLGICEDYLVYLMDDIKDC